MRVAGSTTVCILYLELVRNVGFNPIMTRFLVFLTLILTLSACASNRDSRQATEQNKVTDLPSNVKNGATSTISQTRSGIGEAAMSPLNDLNLRREPIPKMLAKVDSPYDLPRDLDCIQIGRLVGQLNGVLGPDWDTPEPDERLRTEKLADSAAAATLDALSSEASGIIPFRGIVRKLTGAEKHQKKYNRAFKIGAQRRAYLKGLGEAKNCPYPARPDFKAKAEDETIVYSRDAPNRVVRQAKPDHEPLILSAPNAPIVQSEDLQTIPPQYEYESQP